MPRIRTTTKTSLSRPLAGKSTRARQLPHLFAVAWLAFLIFAPFQAHASSRIKDLVGFEGVRDNILVGYGLVVGLHGTGDTLTNSPFTERSLIGMLERLGINETSDFSTIKTANIAAVMVTATLPPFSAAGAHIDVSIGTMGDAKSLQGGILLVTPLQGADGEVYAVAQGTISSGYSASGQSGSSVTKGVPTSGRIVNGAIVEREISFHLADMTSMRLSLRNPDFTTAKRIADVINRHSKTPAEAIDSATVRMQIPPDRKNDIVGLMTEIEQLQVEPDQMAKVVIDEQSGVIVMGENVRINTVAIAQGNLTIRISETPQVSQPNALSTGGTTVVVPRSDIKVDEEKDNKLAMLKTGVSLQELVQSLNALGIGPRDMISILQSIKAAGALQADMELL